MKKIYRCKEQNCERIFDASCKLLQHKYLKHSDRKKYQCNQCPQTFPIYNYLYNHKKRHEIAPFQCAVCYKLFQELRLYNLHLKKFHFMSGMKKEKKCSKEDKQKTKNGSQQKRVQKISLLDIVPGSLGDKVPIRKPSNKGISLLQL